MDVIQLDDVEILVTRKAIRTLRLRICPPRAEVRVSVPLHASRGEVLRFVTGRAVWIRQHRERMLHRYAALPPPCTGETGQDVVLWGETCRLEAREAEQAGVSMEPGRVIVRTRPGSTREQRLHVLRTECRQMLREQAETLMERWAQHMSLTPPELRIRSMRTRWGTCNPRARRIWLSAELVRHVPTALEYVIVHELAHLVERGHGPRFERILDQHLPDWRVRKQALNTCALSPAEWL